MKKFVSILAIVAAILMLSPLRSTAAETDIGQPPVICTQGNGYWRVYNNLVFVMEYCTSYDVDPPDMLVQFLSDEGNPQERCEHFGGRYEFIGSKGNFNLNVCWDTDYIIIPDDYTNPVWDGVTPRVCIDFDGATVVENQGNQTVTHTVPSANMKQSDINGVMYHLVDVYSRWNLVFQVGECLDEKSSTLYITPAFIPGMLLSLSNTDGYAYVGGHGKPGNNIGFIFTKYLNEYTMPAVTAHELGHLFGLNHPYLAERSIMSDGHDWTLDFSASDVALLDKVLVRSGQP